MPGIFGVGGWVADTLPPPLLYDIGSAARAW